MFWGFAASAPTRTLGRRKLVRNRFTIDTDIVFDGDPEQQDLVSPEEPGSKRSQQDEEPDQQQQQQQSDLAGDTDRWVEEQFDLEEYEDQEEVKETDILSDDDDDFCQTPTPASIETDLEAPVMALTLEGVEREKIKSPTVSETSDMAKQRTMINDKTEDQNQKEKDEIWVRREQSGLSPDCAT